MPGYTALIYRFERYLRVHGRTEKTFSSYSRYIAVISLHFGCLPTQLQPEQVHDYLFALQKKSPIPSLSYFKHTVYSLRLLLKCEDLPNSFLQLPSIPKVVKLPVVLSKNEIWHMLSCCKTMKHKLMLGLLYGCGLRNQELRRLQVSDLDVDRLQLRITLTKSRKDRYVPLPQQLVSEFQSYLKSVPHQKLLFESPYPTPMPVITNQSLLFEHMQTTVELKAKPYSQREIQRIVKVYAQRASIRKTVTVHSLRHSFATHLIEDGADILTVQQLLGHQSLRSTLVYLQVAQRQWASTVSPLDRLYEQFAPAAGMMT